MTNLELQSLALAYEVETYLKTGNRTNLILGLNQFRKIQIESGIQFPPIAELGLCPVIQLHERRKFKVIKKP